MLPPCVASHFSLILKRPYKFTIDYTGSASLSLALLNITSVFVLRLGDKGMETGSLNGYIYPLPLLLWWCRELFFCESEVNLGRRRCHEFFIKCVNRCEPPV